MARATAAPIPEPPPVTTQTCRASTFSADLPSFACSSGQCAGHWRKDHHIFLAGDWATDEMVVRHEMLHDLIGLPGHPAPPFGKGCPLTWATWNRGSAAGAQMSTVPAPPVDID